MEIKNMVSIRKSMDCSGFLREPFVLSSRNYKKNSCLGDMFKFKSRIYLPRLRKHPFLLALRRQERFANIYPGEDSPIKVTKETFLSIKTSLRQPRVERETHRQSLFNFPQMDHPRNFYVGNPWRQLYNNMNYGINH